MFILRTISAFGGNAMQTQALFHDLIAQFPKEAAEILSSLVSQSARLDSSQVDALTSCLGFSREELMKNLLPLAAAMSVTPVSHFQVGAVAEGGSGDIYLGANLEFLQHPLKVTVHAEQCVVTNAWHQGENRLKRLLVDEAPCGHCRQFLNELNDVDQMEIIIDRTPKGPVKSYGIADLLPDAFGPADLKLEDRLMNSKAVDLQVEHTDELALKAQEAACLSYAPITQSRAGVALKLKSGRIVSGRYGENAAFNPGISAMEAAIVNWRLALLRDSGDSIVEAVMVEQAGSSSQRYLAEAFLAGYGIKLGYFTV